MHKDFDHDAMVANILAYHDTATPEQIEAGTAWYPLAGDIVELIADRTGIDPARVGFALSALSPRNPWRWNVADAYAFAAAKAEGRTMPSATTFRRNWLAAWRALGQDEAPWLTAAPKVTAFVSCIMGNLNAVVVDTWAVRVATGGKRERVANDRQYALVALAYEAAARARGVAPAVMQAITWLVAQTEGLASHRRGRHDLAFKAGTPSFIMAALTEGTKS
jgi:hypothetical protein